MGEHGQRYERAQQEIARASADLEVSRLLDLGVGSGATTRRCLEAHPSARAVCLDELQDKLDARPRLWARGPSCDLAASRIPYRQGRSN